MEMDCGPKCRSKKHSYEHFCAATKGNTRQVQLFLSRCYNWTNLSDKYGRTVIHAAATKGSCELLEWLLSEKKLEADVKDSESGYTALHRALFYGQLAAARVLINYGASLQPRDKEGLTPLDIVMKDKLAHVDHDTGSYEVYTFGDNANFTLGHDKEQRWRQPEVVEFFRKNSISISQVVMCKFHSVFLTNAGKIYTCGHGRGGRLGHLSEQTVLSPQLVKSLKNEVCVEVAAARDHTVMLMESGQIYICGQMDGHSGQQSNFEPRSLNTRGLKGKVVHGICAQRFHTVLYGDDAVFTFGVNAGQLGHMKVPGEEYVGQPRQVSALNHKDVSIKLVSASDACTVILTTKGDLFALHEYQCRKVASRCPHMVQLRVSGGNLDHRTNLTKDPLREKAGTELTIALLSNTGHVFIWRESYPVLRRCAWSIRRSLNIQQMLLSSQNLVFVTKDGEAFIAHTARNKPATPKEITKDAVPASPVTDSFLVSLTELVEKQELEYVRVDRMPQVHRAVAAFNDNKGNNFAILQAHPNAHLTEIPQTEVSQMRGQFLDLMEEADDMDLIHDVILQVGNERFPCHKYILCSRSAYFCKQLLDSSGFGSEVLELDIKDVNLFKELLKFIYTDDCDLLVPGTSLGPFSTKRSSCSPDARIEEPMEAIEPGVSAYSVYSKKKKKKGGKKVVEEQKKEEKNPIGELHQMAKAFGVNGLTKRLECVKMVDGKVGKIPGKNQGPARLRFNRNDYNDLYDVAIASEDNLELKCHKCVLVARLEYFRSMLGSGWIETSNSHALMLPIPGDILQVIVDFLYTDEASTVMTSEDPEFIVNVLVVADQLLISRLKNFCEVTITSLLSLKNACELLDLASRFNASQLKVTCQQFICLNLAALLETRSLDVLGDDVIEELTTYYRNVVPGMSRRLVTPFDEWPYRDFLESLESEYENRDASSPSLVEDKSGPPSARKNKPRRRRTHTKSTGDDEGNPKMRITERQISVCSDSTDPEVDTSFDQSDLASSPVGTFDGGRSTLMTSVKESCEPMEVESFNQIKAEQSSAAWGSLNKVVHSFRDLMLSEKKTGLPKGQNRVPVKKEKMSNKEKKRIQQAQQKEKLSQSEPIDIRKPQQPVWGQQSSAWSPPAPVISLRDVMIAEEKVKPGSPQQQQMKPSVIKTKPAASGDSAFSWGLSTSRRYRESGSNVTDEPTSPSSPRENPWQKPQASKAARSINFAEIIQDEKTQLDTYQKATNKPLALIQVEEQAIQELMKFYGADDLEESYVTVERMSTALASPTWAATSGHRT